MTLSSSSGDDHMKADKVRQSKVDSSDTYEHACRAVVGSQFRSNNNTDKIKIYIESSSLFHFLRHHIYCVMTTCQAASGSEPRVPLVDAEDIVGYTCQMVFGMLDVESLTYF